LKQKVVVLYCTTCGLPWARIENGVLIVESRHHGERHVNVMPIMDLQIQVESPEIWPPELERKTRD